MALLAPHDAFGTDQAEKPRRRGRPTGNRAKLAQRFFQDLYTAWEEQGESAIARAAFHDPVAFVSIVARLMPQKIEVTQPTDGLSDERLAELLDYADRMAALRSDAAAGDQARLIEGRVQVLEHTAAHEKSGSAGAAAKGGGGPNGEVGGGGIKTAYTVAAELTEADNPPVKHNTLGPSESRGTGSDSQNDTTPLPYPVGKPQPAVADPIDPASLF